MKKLLITVCLLMTTWLYIGQIAYGSRGAAATESDEPIPAEKTTLGITDSLGREVVLDKPAETFIGIMPSTYEFLKILGKEDGIIARDSYTTDTTVYPGIDKLPVINSEGSGTVLDYEKILTLNPDLFIIMKNPAFDPTDAIAKLHPAIPVVVLETDNIYTMGDSIQKLGKLVGNEAEANRFAEFNDGLRKMILERINGIAGSEKPAFFFRIDGWTTQQLCTMTDRSTMVKTQMVDAGGRNVAADLNGAWIQDFDHEWLLMQDYDALIWMVWDNLHPGCLGYDVKNSTEAARLAAEISRMDVFAGSNAVKNGKVFLFDSRISTSPRSIITMAYIAKWLHPERFEDMDPKALHQQYLDDFLHIDIDLEAQGVLYYPDF